MPYTEQININIDEVVKPASKSPRKGKRTFCIMGKTGSGKTHSSGTIPKKQKGLYFDYDGKAEGLMDGNHDNLDIVDVVWSKKEAINNQNKADKVIAYLQSSEELKHKYQFGFIDSLINLYGTMEMLSHKALPGSKFKVNFDKMAYIDDKIWRFFQSLITVVDNLVIYCHEDFRQSESGIGYKVIPLARKALSEGIPGRFQENYHSVTLGEGDTIQYVWETRPLDIYDSNSVMVDVPAIVPNNFALLLGTNWKEVKSVSEAIGLFEKKTGEKVTRYKIKTT